MVRVELVTSATDSVRELVGELDAALSAGYLPEQQHGLALDALFEPDVRFFVARIDDRPVGCAGVALFDDFAEVKRMYVREAARRAGVAAALLARIELVAREAGQRVLRLETGTRQEAAIRFYERAGFTRCEAFGAYTRMPPHRITASLFYAKQL